METMAMMGPALLLREIRKRELWPALQQQLLRTVQKAPVLPAIVRLSERLEPAMRKRFLYAVSKIQNWADLEALARAIENNSLTSAMAAVKLSEFPEAYGELAIDLKAGFIVGAGLTVRQLAESGVRGAFTLINPHAVAYAMNTMPQIVQPFQDGAQEIISTFMAKSLQGEMTPKAAARDIRDLIGLDPPRQRAADAYWRDLTDKGLSKAEIATKTQAYIEKLTRERADMIARTEIHRAAQDGKLDAYLEADRQGYLQGEDWVKVWRAVYDQTTCPICESMDGVAVGLDEPFAQNADGEAVDNGFGDQMDSPDAHPGCRCTFDLVKADKVNDEGLVPHPHEGEKPESRR